MLLRPRRAIAASASASSRLLRLVSSVTAPPPANNVSSFNNRNRSRSMMSTTSSSNGTYAFLKELGLSAREPGVCDGHAWFASGPVRQQINPATGEVIGEVQMGTLQDYERVVAAMDKAKAQWAATPAPVRGEVVRRIGNKLREKQHALGQLVSAEMGKILPEGVGEVQESVDICDFAVGLSRALNGSIIPSERPGHFMMERWNPLKGHVGIISAFNFPNAVYFWNLALSLICGNTNLWKPAESTSLVAIASAKIIQQVLLESGHDPAIATLVCGLGPEVGEKLVGDPRMELISFTGSTKVGRHVNQVVAGRFGKAILELGGNNALIIDASADLELAVRAVLFGAVGTAGQRCTTTRRLLLHADVYDAFLQRLIKAYGSVKIGDPLDAKTLCGPLHNQAAVNKFEATVAAVKAQGGTILVGGQRVDPSDLDPAVAKGFFVQPTIAAVPPTHPALQDEVFAPIMYIVKVSSLEEAIALNNAVPQGLSSALFTRDPGAIFKWTGPEGSDCGIVNVNIGTSGAEIGGAFGGEKETGGGRESGSDSWKQYMRRSTCTINYSKELPLAQGINFGGEEGKIMD